MATLRAIDPATGECIREYTAHTPAQVEAALARAHQAFAAWRELTPQARAPYLKALAASLRTRREDLAHLATREMGKLIAEACAEIDKCAGCCDYFADQGPAMLVDQPVAADYAKSYVAFRPLGTVLAIMPWNFPFWQAVRAAVPAVMAGNALLLKHASSTPGCALALQSLFEQAGFPPGVFQSLLLPASSVGALIDDVRVRAVTLTGSTPAGREIATRAGRALKKTVLELGGSDAFVVLADADIELAARLGAQGRLLNCGQSCIAAKRFVVVESVRAPFEGRLAEVMAERRPGNPMDEKTTLGPMARIDLRDELHRQVERSVALGARCLTGGMIPEGRGAYYPPTVLTGVKPGMPAYEEELFGPVATVIAACDEAEALRIANDSPFGLGATVCTRDVARGERLARDVLEAGSCYVNGTVRSDVRLPFGGVKDSGYGRELSAFGLHEFVNIKAVVVA